jgi:uncharacterized phage-associated protein
MIPYKKEKLENAICYFAQEHKNRSGNYLAQTYLWKYLAFLDFLSVEKIGSPAFDLKYKAMDKGPVPVELYNRRHNYKTVLFEFINIEENKFIIKARGNPKLAFFSSFELDLMNILINRYAKKYSNTDEISEDSHKKIRAWRETHKTQRNGIIDFALTFKEDIRKKKEDDLAPEEEHFKTYLLIKSSDI